MKSSGLTRNVSYLGGAQVNSISDSDKGSYSSSYRSFSSDEETVLEILKSAIKLSEGNEYYGAFVPCKELHNEGPNQWTPGQTSQKMGVWKMIALVPLALLMLMYLLLYLFAHLFS